jgi:hypothetical protein
MSARLAPGTHPAVNQDNEAIEFAVTVDDEESGRFAISFDTLQDHFGAASKLPDDVLRAFHAGEKRILEVAGRKLGRRQQANAGSPSLRRFLTTASPLFNARFAASASARMRRRQVRTSAISATAQNARHSHPPPLFVKSQPFAPCTMTIVPSISGWAQNRTKMYVSRTAQ